MFMIKLATLVSVGLAGLAGCQKKGDSISRSATQVTVNPQNGLQITGAEQIDPKDTYRIGDTLSFRVSLSTQIDSIIAELTALTQASSSNISLVFKIGPNERQASCVANSTPNSLLCTYTIDKTDVSGAITILSIKIFDGVSDFLTFPVADTDAISANILPITIVQPDEPTPDPDPDQGGSTPDPVISQVDSVSVSDGNNQSATVDTSLANPFLALVKDTNNNPVAGVTVTWAIASGSGTLSLTSSITGIDGIATGPILLLGSAAGSYSVTASIETGTTKVATFNATALAAVDSITISDGDNQNGTVGSPLANPFVVVVKDVHNNLISGATINWAVASGGGSISLASSISGVDGVVTGPILTLGTAPGSASVTATVASDTSKLVTFNATAVAGAVDSIVVSDGNNQNGVVAAALNNPFLALVTDAYSNPISGVTVTWAVASGAGSLSLTSSVSGSNGIATGPILTLGTSAGGNSVTATIASGTTKVATFSAVALSDAIDSINIDNGNNQSGTVAAALANPFLAFIKDVHNNPVEGITVNWAVASGGGSISLTSSVSGSDGIATGPILTLGAAAGSNSVTATVAGDSTKTITFNATATAGAADSISISDGNNQSGTVAAALANPFVAIVKDAHANVVEGVTVTWAVASGGGSLSFTSSTSGADGIATGPILTLGATAGSNSITATIATGTTKVATFSATGTAGAVDSISVSDGNNQSGTVAAALANPMVAIAKDAQGNAVAGVTVTWAVASGGGSLSLTSSTSGTDGIATGPILTLGTTAGSNSVTATIATGTTKVATFTATGVAASADSISIDDGNSQSGTVATALSNPFVVLVKDAHNNVVAGVTVSWAVASGGGSLSLTSSISGADGIATGPILTLGTAAGSNSATATIATGTTKVATFSATGLHGAATQLSFTAQPAGAVAGNAFTIQPKVTIQDVYGNTVATGIDASATLSISLTSGTGLLSGTATATASQGVATWSGLSIAAFGDKELTATKPDLTGSGGSADLSQASSIFSNAENPPAVPAGLAAAAGNASIELSWTASSEATSYNILRGTSSGSLSQIGTNTTNSYTDSTASNGVTYYYAVQSVSASGTSVSSSTVQAQALSAPSISSVSINDSSGANALAVTWSASTGASSYTVKYATSSGAAATGSSGCTVTAPTVTCTVSSLSSNVVYWVSVVASNSVGAGASIASTEISGTPMSAPSLSLTASGNEVTPTYSSLGATSYDLSYGTSTGNYPTTVTGATSGNAITSLTNGTTYYFKVVATNAQGSLSSSESSSAPNGPNPFNISTATPGNVKVDLVWGASTGATSYTAKWGTTSGDYTGSQAGISATSYSVTGLTNGTTYYFMVTAINANGTQNASSEFVRIPGQPTISTISAQTTLAKSTTWTASFAYTLGGVSSLTCADTTASSSNTGLVIDADLTFSGTYPNCLLTAEVDPGLDGSATITLNIAYGSASATSNFVLTVLPAAAAAYSARKIVLAYTGYALKVRHGTNNAEADVAFDSTDTISASSVLTITAVGTSSWQLGDQVAFSDFYSGGVSVYVTKWYDQSGASKNIAQTTTSVQPRIVDAGSFDVVTKGATSRVGVRWISGMYGLSIFPGPLSNGNEHTISMVSQEKVRQNNMAWQLSSSFYSHSPWTDGYLYYYTGACCSAPERISSSGTLTLNTLYVFSFENSVTNNAKTVYANSTTLATTTGVTIGTGTFAIGGHAGASTMTFGGVIAEFIVFSSTLGTKRATLETWQTSYYRP